MMNKVRITQDQADAIEGALRNNKWGEDDLLHIHANNYDYPSSKSWGQPFESLNDLAIGDFAKALYIGYEVEPEFKTGDWVVLDNTADKLFKVLGVCGRYLTIHRFGGDVDIPLYRFRHATPEEIAAEKERRWWASHGRGVWELKEGDVLIDSDGGFLAIARDAHFPEGDAIVEVKANHIITSIHGITSRESISAEFIRGDCRVVYFAEQRLDRRGEDE